MHLSRGLTLPRQLLLHGEISKFLTLLKQTQISSTTRCSMISYLLPCLASFCLTYTLLYLASAYGNSVSIKADRYEDE